MTQQSKPLAVISDFDDTIAIENVAELLFEELCSDQGWRELRQQSRDKLISLREYQEGAFRLMGASQGDIQAKVKEKATLRSHFKELCDYTRANGIPPGDCQPRYGLLHRSAPGKRGAGQHPQVRGHR